MRTSTSQGVKLCAITRININGNTLVCVPTLAGGKQDDALWKIHCDAVDKALANWFEIMKLAVATANLLDAFKPIMKRLKNTWSRLDKTH